MTNREAIFVLEHIEAHNGLAKEAKLMAIKALEEPERKKGKWIHIGGDEWACDKCGFVLATEGSWEHPLDVGNYYCKHCGADMRKEKTDG